MSKINAKHWKESLRPASLKCFYPAWAKTFLLIQSVFLGSERSPNSEGTPRPPKTHIDIQDLISGTFSQKGLPGSAGDLVRSLVGEHCPSALVLPRAINCPVPIDDGAARATSQGCGDKWTISLVSSGIGSNLNTQVTQLMALGHAWSESSPPLAWPLPHLNHFLPCELGRKMKDGWEWLKKEKRSQNRGGKTAREE